MAEIDPKAKLLAVYNADRQANGLPVLQLSDFDFGIPEAYNGTRSPANTRIYLTPKIGSLAIGRVTIYYDRIELSTITNILVVKGAATRVVDLLPQIIVELGIALVANDIVDAALPDPGPFTFTASGFNILYKGSASIGYTT